ncbi:hypothetical protein EOM39_02740 [Candidatus Gracilibacteria bacterium]|nr:hypothetical protein [Candidatus Gracilibacteria bacterium]
MKIYYFLNNVSKESFDLYLSKFELLRNFSDVNSIVSTNYAKIGYNPEGTINDANFLEALSFIEFIKNKFKLSYNELLKYIDFIHDENFFIYNEKVFSQNKHGIQEINTNSQKVYFVTSRDFFTSPFFLILNSLCKINNNIHIVKFNIRLNKWSYNDKAYYLSKLYKLRKKLLGEIIVPLFQNREYNSVKLFFKEVQKLIGDKIIIKKNFGDMGIGLKALDLRKLKKKDIDLLKTNFFSENNNNFTGLYIVPFIDIKKEYRIYYRYDKNKDKVTIYSVKNRINKNIEEIFTKSSLKIYEKIDVEWHYNDKKTLEKKYIDKINKICKITKDNIGVLEFFEDNTGKIYFCEINSLGGSLIFSGQDEKDMIKYYIDTWDMIY